MMGLGGLRGNSEGTKKGRKAHYVCKREGRAATTLLLFERLQCLQQKSIMSSPCLQQWKVVRIILFVSGWGLHLPHPAAFLKAIHAYAGKCHLHVPQRAACARHPSDIALQTGRLWPANPACFLNALCPRARSDDGHKDPDPCNPHDCPHNFLQSTRIRRSRSDDSYQHRKCDLHNPCDCSHFPKVQKRRHLRRSRA